MADPTWTDPTPVPLSTDPARPDIWGQQRNGDIQELSERTKFLRDELGTAPSVTAPAVATIIGGQADETLTVTGCTIAADTAIRRTGQQSWRLDIAAAGTATAKLAALTTGETINDHISAIGLMVHIPDPAKITAITMQIYTGASDANNYSFTVAGLRDGLAGNIKTGWNIFRWTPEYGTVVGTPDPWGTIHHARVVVASNAATSVNIQQVFAEVRPKASMIFIHDGGYKGFDQTPGYADLKDRQIPVTWSIDCGLMGDATHITDARIREIGAENRNSISFHGWDATSMATATAAVAQAHTMRALKWLARRGFTGRIWRSAWLQNTATNGPATDNMVVANPYFGAFAGNRTQNTWPFIDRFNVLRIPLQGKTTAQVDALFADLERDHGVLVCYTHKVNDGGNPADITTAEWAYFLSKVDAAVTAGWLESVTLEMLLASSGATIQRGLGGALTVEWPNVDGTTERLFLP